MRIKSLHGNSQMKIERKNVIKPKHPSVPSKGKSIAPTVRRGKLKEAEDEKHDLEYWLSKSPLFRLAAVTEMITKSMNPFERMDKTQIVKRKLGS